MPTLRSGRSSAGKENKQQQPVEKEKERKQSKPEPVAEAEVFAVAADAPAATAADMPTATAAAEGSSTAYDCSLGDVPVDVRFLLQFCVDLRESHALQTNVTAATADNVSTVAADNVPTATSTNTPAAGATLQILRPSARLDHRHLLGPTHLTVTSSGDLVVSSTLGQRLLLFPFNGSEPRLVVSGLHDGWHYPTGLVEAEPGTVWSASGERCEIRKLRVGSSSTLCSLGAGQGDGDGQMRGPEGLALADDTLFVCDQTNHRVVAFDTTELTFAFSFGRHGSCDGELCFPRGLAAREGDPELMVADTDNDRISIFKREGGAFVRVIGSRGTSPGQFLAPDGVVNNGKLLLVAEFLGKRIQVLTRLGGPLQVVSTSIDGRELGQLSGVVMRGSTVFVSDFDNDCIEELTCLSWEEARLALDEAEATWIRRRSTAPPRSSLQASADR